MPPETFHQALQLTYFVQLVLQIESNGHSVSFGRMDQYLYPFYRRDAAAGIIDEAEAHELLECVWLKLLAIKKIRSWSHTRYSAGGPLYQNVTIGGQTRDGKDAVNALSLPHPRVGRRTCGLPQPNLSVRYHRGLRDEFLARCIEVIGTGFGMPAFNNDEIVVPGMLMSSGVSREDARDYSAIGCIEVAVPGKWGYRSTGMSFLNLMRVLLATLNDGVDAEDRADLRHGGTGTLETSTSFDELMAAWKDQLAYYARPRSASTRPSTRPSRRSCPTSSARPSPTTASPAASTSRRAGAVYDFVSGLQVGIANLGNSLAAIKKLVFEERPRHREELLDGARDRLRRDRAARSSGSLLQPGAEVRQRRRLRRLPRWSRPTAPTSTRWPSTTTPATGAARSAAATTPGTSSISANVPSGSVVPATPDGRTRVDAPRRGLLAHAGHRHPSGRRPSSSRSPSSPLRGSSGGVLLNQKLSPQAIATPGGPREAHRAPAGLLRRALKGWHVQYNIVSRETLLDAKRTPRSTGTSSCGWPATRPSSTTLSRETQDDIIARTEHRL